MVQASLKNTPWLGPLLVLCALLGTASAESVASTYIEDTERFPGWKGELPHIIRPDNEPKTIGFGEGGVVRIPIYDQPHPSYHPNLFIPHSSLYIYFVGISICTECTEYKRCL